MQPIGIIRHSPFDGPAYLADFLTRRQLPSRVIAIDAGGQLPRSTDGFSGFVLLGGRGTLYDPQPWIETEIALVRAADAQGLPLLGFGLGAQIIASALDAMVVRNPVKQIGWFEVDRVTSPDAPAWTQALPPRFELIKWHTQAFGTPPGAVRIARSRWTQTEAFVRGKVMAWQGHPELTGPLLRSWVRAYREEIAQPEKDVHGEDRLSLNWNAVIQGPEQLTARLDERVGAVNGIAEIVFGAWAAHFG